LYKLFVDGGGQTIKNRVFPTYFSCKAFLGSAEIKGVSLNRWYLKSLIPHKYSKTRKVIGEGGEILYLTPDSNIIIPRRCSILDLKGKETNNISEYAALYYGLLRFVNEVGIKDIQVYTDSQLIVNQVLRIWPSKKHLKPWCDAVQDLKWKGVILSWIPREQILEVLGH